MKLNGSWSTLAVRVVLTLPILALLESCTTRNDGEVDLSGGWSFKADSADQGVASGWYTSSCEESGWSAIEAGKSWEDQGFAGYDGVGWYRRTISIPDAHRRYALFFGSVDDKAEVWLNGKLLGAHAGANEPFYFLLGEDAGGGDDVIAVRVTDDGGAGGLTDQVVLIPEDQVQELYKTPFSNAHARPSPDWVREAVVYEVYLRSFSKEGTFEGLRKQIPELRDLGVTVIWLMPIHPIGAEGRKGTLGSPYSVKDYYAVNPEFGTIEDFRRLVSTIHENGMRVILDLVANHTSWDNKILAEHPEWYTIDQTGKIVFPNPDWTDVADLNFNHHELRKYMLTMMRYWVETFDIDGYRCDVTELVPLDFWEQARVELERIKPVMMLSEGSLPEHHVGAFDITYAWNTYDILSGLLSRRLPPSTLTSVLTHERLAFPVGSLRLRFNTNHDKNAWDAPAGTKFTGPGVKLTSLLMFTLPGVPLVYNGQEVGDTTRLSLFEKVAIDWSDPDQYWPFYRNLARLRREHPVFVYGDYEELPLPDSTGVFSFARTGEGESVVVAANFGADTVSVSLSVPLSANPPGREFFTGERVDVSAGTVKTRLAPKGFRVILFGR
jgi:cyclomaltodextrinase / maltogenic alpha-amylase / neopullulanase